MAILLNLVKSIYMQSGVFPGNLIPQSGEFPTYETCHVTPIQLLICCYRVKMYTEQEQSPCDFVSQIVFWNLRRLAQFASLWCNNHA